MRHALTAAAAPVRIARRLSLALRFYHHLGYTWHLAWVKAAR